MMTRTRVVVAAVLAAVGLSGCESGVPKSAFELSEQSLENRQLQTRRFDTRDEATLLSAAAGLLQDFGFSIDESESKLGFIVGSKERDATDSGQIAGAFMVAVLTGAASPVDDVQRIRASVVTHTTGQHTSLRVTFQRVIWDTNGQVSRLEFVNDPEIYNRFFERLSKAVFLEAHSI